jgi:hypothetical protein
MLDCSTIVVQDFAAATNLLKHLKADCGDDQRATVPMFDLIYIDLPSCGLSGGGT